MRHVSSHVMWHVADLCIAIFMGSKNLVGGVSESYTF